MSDILGMLQEVDLLTDGVSLSSLNRAAALKGPKSLLMCIPNIINIIFKGIYIKVIFLYLHVMYVSKKPLDVHP